MIKKTIICTVLALLCLAGLAHAEETVKIASVFAKSGPAGSSNLHHLQAVRYAVDEINRNGGLLGKQVELIEFDNQGTPIQSRIAARKAAETDACAVVGASWSDHSLAMAPVLQKAGIPMISPDSTTRKLTLIGDYIFRACFIDPFQGQALAKFAREEFDAKSAVILEDVSSSYSLGLSDEFARSFTERGGEITGRFGYKKDQTDFSEIVAQAKQAEPDILFIPGHDESGIIVNQAQKAGITAIMMGGDGWGYRAFISNGGKDLRNGYYTTHWSRDIDTPESKKFVQEYQKIYDLNDFAAVSYDSMMILADAIRRAGTTDRKAVRDALAATKNFKGVTGTISFNENGDPIKPAVVLRFENGKTSYYKTIQP